MAVEALDTLFPKQGPSPVANAFLRFYGVVCSIPSVQRVGLDIENLIWNVWVRLDNGNEADEDAVYTALQRYRAGAATEERVDIDLHVIFPDEPESAWPSSIKPIFVRE
jgi:hypothetical protein